MNLNELKKFQDETLKENSFNTKKPFIRKRIRLDEKRTFSDTLTSNNFTASFRAFWVVGASNDNFKVNMIINPENTLGDSIPLRPNMNFDFGQTVDGARFEFEAQAGGYVDILFFSIGFGQIGNVELKGSSTVGISTGAHYTCDKVTIGGAATLLLGADSARGQAYIVNGSSESIFIGEQSKLSDYDWGLKSIEIGPGERMKWTNASGVYARTGGAFEVDITVLEETF